MKGFLISIIGVLLMNCSANNIRTVNHSQNKTIKQKTSNPNTPYIYKNGFENFEVVPILSVNDVDTVFVNELQFYAVYSALYTQKVMYDRFGKWNKEVYPNNSLHPVLVWEKRKLFEYQDELYSIAAGGIENTEDIYASIIVLDSKKRDCLSEKSKIKDSIIKYFSNQIKNLSSDRKFYKAYWRLIRKHK